jgi:hypothetical protein
MGGSSSSTCGYTNQGERIDGLKDQIGTALQNARDLKNSPNFDINTYFINLINLYGNNNYSGEKYQNKNPVFFSMTDLNKLKIDLNNNILRVNKPYKFKSFNNIIGLTTNAGFIYDSMNDNNNVDNHYEYFFYHNVDSQKGPIQIFFEKGIYYKDLIDSQQATIADLTKTIKEKYGDIDLKILENDNKIKDINIVKGNIIDKSYSVSYFENLLLQSYKELYDAINIENHVLINNKNIKTDAYSTDNSKYSYEKEKIKYYENINTFLFYFYYLLIIVLVTVVLKFNDTSILIKLTFFRIFAILLILYPLFILKFQNYIYKLFSYLYSYLPPFFGSKNVPSGTLIKPKTNSSE